MDVVKFCDNYPGLLPIPDGAHLSKRTRKFLIRNNSVINHSADDVNFYDVLNASKVKLITENTSKRVFDTSKMLSLDDKIAFSMLNVSNINKYVN